MVNYVNYKGEPIDFGGAAGAKKKVARVAEPRHEGFLAVGFSPERIERARRDHDAHNQELAEEGRTEGPFDPLKYTARSKPDRIMKKPYATPDAAAACCDLATRQGWIGCRVIENIKGKK